MSVTVPFLLPTGEGRVAPLVRMLAAHGERTALTGTGAGEGLSYADLAARVDRFAADLRVAERGRRLVLLEAHNDADTLVAWFGSLAAGCPVLLTGPGAARDALAAAYDPDVVWDGALVERRTRTAHELHPDLALLLSTSGSTGSPKLVRLSHTNLLANARSIADYLGVRPSDVAATTLPVHYCYGLSVVHSHLVSGATVHLTERSVTEADFWPEARAAGVTTFPGVPHTFELLEATGFTGAELPTLRYLTQAGGKLAPDAVRRHAARGAAAGWDLVVMYGATEATARMAFLPPHLASTAPETIGIPIPGGTITVEPRPDLAGTDTLGSDPEVGELVYRGDNVMLGYASTPAELALGRTVHELRTGDLGRQRDDGLFEVVGRCSRIAKVFGLRVDLDRVERSLLAGGTVAAVADGGDALVVAVASGAAPVAVRRVLAEVRDLTGLPPAGVRVVTPTDLPRLASGKVDYRAIAGADATPAARTVPEHVTGEDVAEVFATLLGKDATPADSFRDLHGDSLSYVEASLRLEALLGTLPADWTGRTAADLAGEALPHAARLRRLAPPRGLARILGPRRTVETSVLLRALAIVTIVGSHGNLFVLLGGAHTLFAVLGFNFARFQAGLPGAERVRAVAGSLARIVVPSALVIGSVATYHQGVTWKQIFLLNWLLGPSQWENPMWRYWFIEVAVLMTLAATALLAVPSVSRLAARRPFALPLGLAALALVPRFALRTSVPDGDDVDVLERVLHLGPLTYGGGDHLHQAHNVFWLFALGWAAANARTTGQRLLVTAVALVGTWDFFVDEPARELYIVLGLLALTWIRGVRVPERIACPAGVLAAASMWIYLVHWEIYPHLEHRIPLLATLLSLVAGVAAWAAWSRVEARVRRRTA